MKRVKLTLASLAIVVAVASAFTTKTATLKNGWFGFDLSDNDYTVSLGGAPSAECDNTDPVNCAGRFDEQGPNYPAPEEVVEGGPYQQ